MDSRRNNLIVLALVVVLLGVATYFIFIAEPVTESTQLGLDLQGGVKLVFQGKPTKQQPEVTPEGLDRALDIIDRKSVV